MQLSLTRLAFSIPHEDAREFAGLPQKTRDRVNWLLDVMKAIAAVDTRGDTEATHAAYGRAQKDYKDSLHELVSRNGLKRVPGLKLNTAAFREASRPSARDRSLSEAGFDPADMLDEPDDSEAAEVTSATFFDPADLL